MRVTRTLRRFKHDLGLNDPFTLNESTTRAFQRSVVRTKGCVVRTKVQSQRTEPSCWCRPDEGVAWSRRRGQKILKMPPKGPELVQNASRLKTKGSNAEPDQPNSSKTPSPALKRKITKFKE